MFYDLHIHSVLSPCANDDMTPNNIINMAKLKGLDLIAVCDHNSVKQQAVLAQVALKNDMCLIYGIEVQTLEEVHVLAYFKDLMDCLRFGQLIDERMIYIKNDERYFGNQYVMDINDQVVSHEERLLLSSVNMKIDEVEQVVHKYNGSFVLAHALDRINGIITQLGFIPKQLKIDGVEVKDIKQKERLLMDHPWLDVVWLFNSDAHSLEQINERKNSLSSMMLDRLYRNGS